MELAQLEHFLAVVEERSFTRAAERVCRTQPAVSQSIKKLEVHVPVQELNLSRRTLMVYRDQGYVSDSALELIKIVRNFNWDATVTPFPAGVAAAQSKRMNYRRPAAS